MLQGLYKYFKYIKNKKNIKKTCIVKKIYVIISSDVK